MALKDKLYYERHKEKVLASNKSRYHKCRDWYREYKRSKSCVQCGESHPATISFHHRDESTKEIDPGLMIQKGWSIERMKTELDKCDALCHNCHAKLHWAESWEAEAVSSSLI